MDPAQLPHAVLSLLHQVQQHQALFNELQVLKDKVLHLENEKNSLLAENEDLRAQIRDSQSPVIPDRTDPGTTVTASALPSPAKKTNVSATSWATKAAAAPRKPLSGPASIKKRVASARVFQNPSSKGPQGYTYVYLGRSRKIQRSEVRSHLRGAGVDIKRILDICFPASGVLGLLMHVQYVEEFTSIMKLAEAEIISDFDPLDVKNLADPKFASLDVLEREQKLFELVHDRAISTLSFLRPLLVASVGRTFETWGWIVDSELQDEINAAKKRLEKLDPKLAAFVFKSSNRKEGASDSDSEMDY